MTLPIIKEPIDWKKDSVTLLIIAAVCFIQAAAINGFYVPHMVLSGGYTGVAMLVHYLFGFPTWAVIAALNIPTVLIGLKFLRPKTVLFSAFAPFIFSVCFSLTEGLDFGVSNSLLSVAAGSCILGAAAVFVINRDATLGGTDIIALILARRFSIPMGTFSLLFNLVIMSMLGFTRGLELALLSILGSFVSNAVFNYGLRGFNRTNTVLIFSEKWKAIAPHVLHDMGAGLTYLHGEGGYTHEFKEVVLCMVRTSEIARLKAIVKHEDPNAMFSIIETKEIVGRGFSNFS
ncbi:MAG: YitT family protein [Clostridia bacterium]|nr:YitT family protein [Clostridia bacterium]